MTRFNGKYLRVTTFRRDGTPVATPVWFVQEGDRLLIRTGGRSGKVKRIRNNPSVMVAEASSTGRAKAPPIPARAEVLPDTEMAHVGELMAQKYRMDRIFILPIYNLIQRLRHRGSPSGEEVVLAITPNEESAAA
jgi:PPOX class probable F420-dependent enzyme